MNSKKFYIAILAFVTVLYLVVEITNPPAIDWTPTYFHEHDRPFGTSAISKVLPDIFPEVRYVRNSMYELKELDSIPYNLVISSSDFSPIKLDFEVLSSWATSGRSILVASHTFSGILADTFGIDTEDYHVFGNPGLEIDIPDSITIGHTRTQRAYPFPTSHAGHYFKEYDTAQCQPVMFADGKRATFLEIPWGQGAFFLSSNPEVFTNYYFLQDNNYLLAQEQLQKLPFQPLAWNEYYQMGDVGSSSPLRFVLSQESLRWAYFLTIAGLLLFVIFEAKRRQRVIPVIEAPKNTSIEFVKTIGNLYLSQKDHKNLGNKKVTFFLDHLRKKYFLSTQIIDRDFFEQLAHKSGKSLEEVEQVFNAIEKIKEPQFNDNDLLKLNNVIEEFIRDNYGNRK